MEIYLIFIFGAIIGSFLNVCIYRLPKELSIITPRSFCPICEKTVKWYDNIPLISFIVLKGKCRNCSTKINWHYLIVEIMNASIYVLLYQKFSLNLYFFIFAIISSIFIVITFIDLFHQIIPDKCSYVLIIIGIILNVTKGKDAILDSFIGLLAGGGFLYLVAVLSRGGMGGGDIKLAGGCGAILGLKGVANTLVTAFILGAVVGIILMLFKIKGRKDPIPFWAFIVLGAFITIFGGNFLISHIFPFVY